MAGPLEKSFGGSRVGTQDVLSPEPTLPTTGPPSEIKVVQIEYSFIEMRMVQFIDSMDELKLEGWVVNRNARLARNKTLPSHS